MESRLYRRSLRLFWMSSVLLAFPSVLLAAPGDLVGDFGTDGVVTFDFGYDQEYASDMATDASGRILALMYAYDAGTLHSSYLVRFDAGGVIDDSFGDNGTVTLGADIISDGPVMWTALAPAPDGSAAIFGSLTDTIDLFERQVAVARIDGGGTLDGDATALTVDGLTATSGVSSLVVQDVYRVADGGYVAAGLYTYEDGTGTDVGESFVLFLTADLELRAGVSSIVLQDVGSVSYRDMTVDAEGNVWLLVLEDVEGSSGSVVYKFTADGTPDNTFADNGQLPMTADELLAQKLAVSLDGRLLLAGDLPGGERTIAAFDADGNIVSQFGVEGNAALGDASDCKPWELKPMPDGGVQFTGFVSHGGLDLDLCIVAVSNDGDLKSGFGVGGMFLLDTGPGESGWSLSFDDNGDLVVFSDTYAFTTDLIATPILTLHHGLFPDVTPDVLAFENAGEVDAGVLVTSGAVALDGLASDAIVPIRVEDGEYRISGADWTSEPGWIASGAQVAVRHTSATAGGTVETRLIVGGWQADDGESVRGESTTAVFTSTVKAATGGSGGSGGGGALSLLMLPVLFFGATRRRQRG